MDDPSPKSGWLERLSTLLIRKPEDREQLITLLHSAFKRNLLDSDALSMIEGVMQVSEMQARDIMVPRSQMDVVDISEKPEKFIPFVIEAAHSRFPVVEGSEDDIIGILLAKDLLRYYADPEEFNVRDMLRPAVFIPESKRLNVLLKDFRSNRNHMAIVVNEYGGVAGLVTIEDVLEQIVGEIEDEYDFDEEEDNIVMESDGTYRVKAITEIDSFNEALGANFSSDDYDTIGGLVLNKFNRLPSRNESVVIDQFKFTVQPEEFNVRDMLRPAVFIPESKRLNVLLKDFRSNRNHMAIVVNEYGGVAGLVTIEDVLEQIVGEIEDEYDFDEEEDNIVMESDGTYRVKAITEIDSFNEALGANFSSDDYDTIGGLVLNKFNRLPSRNESVVIDQFKFTVQRADSRRLHMLKVEKMALAPETVAD